jgi:hypothetical protein
MDKQAATEFNGLQRTPVGISSIAFLDYTLFILVYTCHVELLE